MPSAGAAGENAAAGAAAAEENAAAVAAWSPYLHVPGVRFIPSDLELLVHYLEPKLRGDDELLPTDKVRVCDVYSGHPKELTSSLGDGIEGYWYMFSPRNRKYRNGTRPSRNTGGVGLWKAMSNNDEILDGNNQVIGYKRPLTYHVLDMDMDCSAEEDPMRLNDWVLCKVTNKDLQRRRRPQQKPEKEKQPEQHEEQVEEEMPAGSSIAGGDAVDAVEAEELHFDNTSGLPWEE
ncbi:hypothetical protein ABZP36_009351 [Zizania latifolia]